MAPCEANCGGEDVCRAGCMLCGLSERRFVAAEALRWNLDHYYAAPLAVAVYLALCYLGTQWMKSRPAFDLRTPLKYWNLALAVFSFVGMVGVAAAHA